MKIYSRTLTASDVLYALEGAKRAGLITEHATTLRPVLEHPVTRGQHQGKRCLTMILGMHTKTPGDRRRPAAGGRGYALTQAEWGHVIAELFARDPRAQVGPYSSPEHFARVTSGDYPVPAHVLAG